MPTAVVRLNNEEPERRGTRQRMQTMCSLLVGPRVLDIGCAHGDGCESVPSSYSYDGVDLNTEGRDFPQTTWPDHVRRNPNRRFHLGDFRDMIVGTWWDTIVALEVLEHLPDGREWAQRLKSHCDRLIISVPKGQSGPGEAKNGHVLTNLSPSDFPGFLEVGGGEYSMILLWDKMMESADAARR